MVVTSQKCPAMNFALISEWCCKTPGCSTARLRENIAFGNPEATEEQLLEAARATYVDRFVHSLPMGYDTRVDDEGDRDRRRRRKAVAHDRQGISRRSQHPDPR